MHDLSFVSSVQKKVLSEEIDLPSELILGCFEALPKTGKPPNTPGGVRAKALTPHPQRVNILIPSAYFYTLDNNKPNSNFSCLNLSPTRNAQYHVKL